MTADPLHLAELVCVRFSHDLSGLLGSLNGVLELVADSQAGPAEDVALAAETANTLMLRLKLLRGAWGGVSEPMDVAAIRSHAIGLVGGHRLELDLDGLANDLVFEPPMARLLLNVLLLANEALPRGGVLTLSAQSKDQVMAQIDGPGAAWPTGFALFITDGASAWAALASPRDVQAPLTALIAHAAGMRLSLLMAASGNSPPPLLLTPAGA